jgi:hypothetical protein
MIHDYPIYDKAKWHYPQGEGCPSLDAAQQHIRAVLDWLHREGLLNEDGEEIYGSESGSDLALSADMVTEEGERILDEFYEPWIETISYLDDVDAEDFDEFVRGSIIKYAPDQLRDWHGRWTDMGTGAGQDSAPTKDSVARCKKYVKKVYIDKLSKEQADTVADVIEDLHAKFGDAVKVDRLRIASKEDGTCFWDNGINKVVEIDTRAPVTGKGFIAFENARRAQWEALKKNPKADLPVIEREIKRIDEGLALYKAGKALPSYSYPNFKNPMEGQIRHEFGHAFHDNLKSKIDSYFHRSNKLNWGDSDYSDLYTDLTKKYAVTTRGAESWEECVAENFTFYSAGKNARAHAHPDMVKMFEAVTKGSGGTR